MPPDALGLQSVRKTFVSPHGERTLVIDIETFRLEHAGSLGLKGMSGSGKTTLLHLISGVLRPDEGSVRVAGVEMSALSESRRDAARGRLIGYVFQSFNLLPGFTALENVTLAMAMGRGVDTTRAKAMLDRVGMADRLDHYPAQLSSGQQQRVAVARALANRPALVLADEPTGALDPHHARQTLDLLREACAENDAALLLVSHDESALKALPRVLDLADINRAADPAGRAALDRAALSAPEPADA